MCAERTAARRWWKWRVFALKGNRTRGVSPVVSFLGDRPKTQLHCELFVGSLMDAPFLSVGNGTFAHLRLLVSACQSLGSIGIWHCASATSAVSANVLSPCLAFFLTKHLRSAVIGARSWSLMRVRPLTEMPLRRYLRTCPSSLLRVRLPLDSDLFFAGLPR